MEDETTATEAASASIPGARYRQMLAIIAAAGLIVLIILLVGNALRASAAQKSAQFWERHTLEVVIETQRVLTALQAAETGQRGYLLSGSAADLALSKSGALEARQHVLIIRALTRDNPIQQHNVTVLGTLVEARLGLLDKAVIAKSNGPFPLASDQIKTAGDQNMAAARAEIARVTAVEQRLLAKRRAVTESVARRSIVYIVALSALGIGLLMAALVFGLAAWRAADRMRLAEAAREAIARARASEQAEARTAAIITSFGNSIPDLIYAKDVEGRMLYANPPVLALIGRPAEEVIGRFETEWTGREENLDIRANDGRVMANGVVHIFDEVYTDTDGTRRVYRSTKSPLRDAAGAVIGIAAVTIDVTAERAASEALRASEERFRTLSATLPSFIFVADADGQYTFANTVFQQFTGKSTDELMGLGWLDTVHPEDRDRVSAAWDDAWQTQSNFELEYRFRHHADGYRMFQVRALPLRDIDGTVVQWVGVCNDSQELIEARDALSAINADLESRVMERTLELQHSLDTLGREIEQREASEAQVRQLQKIESVGQLTGGIAHDFNNMLSIVIGSLDMAKRRLSSDPERAKTGIENAEEGAKRAAQLTSRLLAFSRQQPLAPEVLDPNKLVSNMSELLRRTIGETVAVETVLAGGLWRSLVDPSQLENAILNLCVNARDAMPDGGRLTIETANAHLDDAYSAAHLGVAPGQYVVIAVTDTGTGMPAAVIERAFDPFYTTKGVGKGTGLGLSQVYGFVKQSNGHVKIYSEPGEGTTIKLYLPRHFGAASEARQVAAVLGDIPRALDGETVLVVEDEAGVRLLSIDVLESLGYRVLDAANGTEALERLDQHPEIDLLFTDIVMPGMNGRALADEALRRRPELKVLFTTGYTRNAVVHNGTLDPGVAFLPKPFTVDGLARKIRAVFDGRGANRAD